MKRRRKYKVYRRYMDDSWGQSSRKGRMHRVKREMQCTKTVRYMRRSEQNWFRQRLDKEFYLRRKLVIRKRRTALKPLKMRYKTKRYYGIKNGTEYKRMIRRAHEECKRHRYRCGAKRSLVDVVVGRFERRIESTIYRMNIGVSMEESKEPVRRGFVVHNGEEVKRIGRVVSVGDVVGIRWDRRREIPHESRVRCGMVGFIANYPRYSEANHGTLEGILYSEPCIRDIPYTNYMLPGRIGSELR